MAANAAAAAEDKHCFLQTHHVSVLFLLFVFLSVTRWTLCSSATAVWNFLSFEKRCEIINPILENPICQILFFSLSNDPSLFNNSCESAAGVVLRSCFCWLCGRFSYTCSSNSRRGAWWAHRRAALCSFHHRGSAETPLWAALFYVLLNEMF